MGPAYHCWGSHVLGGPWKNSNRPTNMTSLPWQPEISFNSHEALEAAASKASVNLHFPGRVFRDNGWDTLQESNIAMENPPFWWYLPGKMGMWMGYVSFREDRFSSWVVSTPFNRGYNTPIILVTMPFLGVRSYIFTIYIHNNLASGWTSPSEKIC